VIVDPAVDLADVQGNILRGYKKPLVRHLVLTVNDSAAARRWLLEATSGDAALAPQVTTAAKGSEEPPTCLNVGMTYAGLAALGVAPKWLATFPREFIDGMAARAVKLGDTGPNDPRYWKREWRDSAKVHLVVSVHADVRDRRDETADRVLGAGGGRAFVELARLDGEELPGGLVHFGYKDNIAQPHFDGIRDPTDRPDMQPLVEVGAVLLGYNTPVEDLRWEVPEPREDLGFNGSFNAFRVLEQQLDEFECFLSASADAILKNPLADQLLPPKAEQGWDPPLCRRDAMRELVAAKILGRWRNGVPLVLSPTSPTPYPPIGTDRLNKFDFTTDPDGLSCPMGSHIRRCNPRGARIVQRNTNHSRRIVRRGMPYGPPYDPEHPDDGVGRGLLGVFICASLIAQFESIQYDWMNLGLQDPRITGTNDPVVGNNEPEFSSFNMPVGKSSIELRGFPRFVHTKGGAYLFLPSLRALRYLGSIHH
jgi:deferrochelatase/peroxidase EfeB